MLLSDLAPFFGVGAFGAAGGGVELATNPGAEFFGLGGADPGAFFFGVAEEEDFAGHIFGSFGVACVVAVAGVSVWFVEVRCHWSIGARRILRRC